MKVVKELFQNKCTSKLGEEVELMCGLWDGGFRIMYYTRVVNIYCPVCLKTRGSHNYFCTFCVFAH